MQNAAANPLASQVAQAIENSPHVAAAQLTYETHHGHVVLKGTVGSYFQKQMAQEALRHIDGLDQIDNELEVTW